MSVDSAKPIPEPAAAPEPVVLSRAILRRAVLSCTVGQVFEIYDFVVYGFMATALARAFFPGGDLLAGLLKTFATFAVGFLVRPLGAVITGSYGDRHGRRQALVLTIRDDGGFDRRHRIASRLTRPSASRRRSCWFCAACSRDSPPGANGAARRRSWWNTRRRAAAD